MKAQGTSQAQGSGLKAQVGLRILSIVVVVSQIMLSCATVEGPGTNDQEPSTIQVEGAKFDIIKSEKLLASSEFIFLESNEKCNFSESSYFLTSTNEFYVLDPRIKNMVFRFNVEGKFLNTIGNQGEGPEEYSSIRDALINGEFIEILSRNVSCNVYKYTKVGKFIEKNTYGLEYPSSFIKTPGSEDYLFYCYARDYKVFRVNPEGIVIDSLLPQKQENRLLFPFDALIRAANGSVFLNEVFYNIIWQWDGKGFIERYILDFGKYTFYQGEKDKERNFEAMENGSWAIRCYQENDEYLFFSVLFNDPDVLDFADVLMKHIIYHKQKGKAYELGNGDIRIQLQDPFAITQDNKLYLFGSPVEMAEWDPWLKIVKDRNLPFDIEGNPIVVIVDLDELMTNN